MTAVVFQQKYSDSQRQNAERPRSARPFDGCERTGMKPYLRVTALALMFAGGARFVPAQSACQVAIHVDAFRNSKGHLGVNVFRSSDGWPEDVRADPCSHHGLIVKAAPELHVRPCFARALYLTQLDRYDRRAIPAKQVGQQGACRPQADDQHIALV
jgi:hypothetical protein